MNLKKTPIKNNVRLKKEKDGFVLFNLDTSGFHFISEDSGAIINACDGKNTVEGLINKFSKERKIDKKKFKKSLVAFLDKLLERKIIKWQE